MSIVKAPYKTFTLPIAICSIIITVVFAIYYYTKGGFFDGILLTALGISSTFLLLLLTVLIFKLLTNLFVRESYRLLGVLFSFTLTAGLIGFVFFTLFKLVTQQI